MLELHHHCTPSQGWFGGRGEGQITFVPPKTHGMEWTALESHPVVIWLIRWDVSHEKSVCSHATTHRFSKPVTRFVQHALFYISNQDKLHVNHKPWFSHCYESSLPSLLSHNSILINSRKIILPDYTMLPNVSTVVHSHAPTRYQEEHEMKQLCNESPNVQLAIERSIPGKRGTGYIETVFKRQATNDSTRIYTMSLQTEGATFPLFMAERQAASIGRTSHFVIRTPDSSSAVGILTRNSAKGSTILYELLFQQNHLQVVTNIQYEVPSVFQTLTDAPPRRAVVQVVDRGSVETVEPCSKEGGRKSLDFRGRGREASKKNMQLQDGNGKVVLQFVKWSKDVFHLDFA